MENNITGIKITNETELFSRDIKVLWLDIDYADGTRKPVPVGFTFEAETNMRGMDNVRRKATDPEYVESILRKARIQSPDVLVEGNMIVVLSE